MFTESANQLEQAEFYDDNSELVLLFLFECYLLMIGKTWVLEANSLSREEEEVDSTANFAFGPETVQLNFNLTFRDSGHSDALMAQCRRVSPTNTENQGKWLNSVRKEREMDEFLRFPLVFTRLLQFVSIGKLLESPLMPFLVGLIRRLLHTENLPVLQVEGLKMLLNLLKAASHESEHPIILECIQMFKSLIDVKRLCRDVEACEDGTLVSTPMPAEPPLINRNRSEFEGPAKGSDLEILNEIFAFITWDLNPDLHSTRFLYTLLKDTYLSPIYPKAFEFASSQCSRISLAEYDRSVCGKVQELVVDYLALWFLQSGTRTFKFGGSTLATNLRSSDRSSSMVSLVVSDLTNFFNKTSNNKSNRKNNASLSGLSNSPSGSLSTRKDHKSTEFPVASFLLDEIILNSTCDVVFLHLILKSACYTLSFAAHLFSIKLALEIFRSWLFNPSSRRPNFLSSDPENLDEFTAFYLDSLEGLFPHKHLPLQDRKDEDQCTLPDRVEIYREAFYFFRATALQAFFSLSLDRWLQLLSIEIVTIDLLLSPDNFLERPFFTTEDSTFTETLLGSLLRSCEHFSVKSMQDKWLDASRILSKCSGCRGVIEEWCRVIETLALVLVKDPRFSKTKNSVSGMSSECSNCSDSNSNINSSSNSKYSSTSSIAVVGSLNNSPILSSVAGSSTSLPPVTASFSAWPDLPIVRSKSVNLFRNLLRLFGDPAACLQELKLARPDLMALIYEAFNRCLDILMKCRMDQSVKIPLCNIPPIGDLLPAALSALLNLKSYNSIISKKLSATDAPQVAHDSCRIISWRIAGTIMFRPLDVAISDHYWGALLFAVRECLNEPMSAAEYTALFRYIALPISTAVVPGCTILLSEIIDGMLRFFNDTLWSGNSAMAFSASDASVLIPVSMKVISNSLKLSRLFPGQFGHFREESCLPRLLKMLISCINDSKLLVSIHTALADIYCSESVKMEIEQGTGDFAKFILELVLEPFTFSRGSAHVHVVICLCEHLSLLANLWSSSSDWRGFIDSDAILSSLIGALEVGAGRAELSEALIRILEGPLTDWILFALRGIVPDAVNDRLFACFDMKCASLPLSRAIELFAMRLMTHSRTFPGVLGPSVIGSEAFVPHETPHKLLLSLALTPSQTILTFESFGASEDIFVTMRNPFGKFTWKIGALWGSDSLAEVENEGKCVSSALMWDKVLADEEFPLPKVSLRSENDSELLRGESSDLLKELLESLKLEHPEIVKRESSFAETSLALLSGEEVDLVAEQHEFESKLVFTPSSSEFERFEPANCSSLDSNLQSRSMILLRLLLGSLSLTRPELYTSQPGFGLEVLREAGDSLSLEQELCVLDGISSRLKVKVGCVFMAPGVCDEEDLFDVENSNDFGSVDEDYQEFLGGMVDVKTDTSSSLSVEFEVHEFERLKGDEGGSLDVKKQLGNDSVLIVWHGDNADTLVNRSPLRSELTAAIIRIRRHSLIPGWFSVTLQTCYERLLQPRKYARLRTDPFALFGGENGGDEGLESETDGVFMGHDIQRSGILVPRASLSLVVKSLACAAWRQANLINCVRSSVGSNSTANVVIDAQARIKFCPEMVRRSRIEEIIDRFGMHDLTYDKFLSHLFQ